MAEYKILKEAKLPFELVILIIAGMTMLIAGILLSSAPAGRISYYEDGLTGLLLFMFSLQIITLGKTPVGDMDRSIPLMVIGMAIAILGIVTCFIPDVFGRIPRLILILCFSVSGFFSLLQMLFDPQKGRAWLKHGRIFIHLIVACSAVYGLSMVNAMLIWRQSLVASPATAVVLILYGAAILYLAIVLREIYCAYPEVEPGCKGEVRLSIDQVMLILMSTFMMILGGLLIPVKLGVLPFAENAQLGLLAVIISVRMLASGSTPIGPFTRSWLVVLLGIVLAGMGIASCIVPKMLVSFLIMLIGTLNIFEGIISLVRICIPLAKGAEISIGSVPIIYVKLFASQVILAVLCILFGASMLLPDLIPGLLVGVILAANGAILLYLVKILVALSMVGDSA